MKIKVKNRIKALNVDTHSSVFSTADHKGLELDSTCGVARVEITRKELLNAFLHLAPYGAKSRDAFFTQLRAEADRRFPTHY